METLKMERKLLMNDDNCLLVDFANQPNKIAVGFTIWLKDYCSPEQVLRLIKNGQTTEICWPSAEIYPAKKMLSHIEHLKSEDWMYHKVRILNSGDWITMHERMCELKKRRLKVTKTKVKANLSASCDVLSGNVFLQHTVPDEKCMPKITENGTQKTNHNKRKSTNIHNHEKTLNTTNNSFEEESKEEVMSLSDRLKERQIKKIKQHHRNPESSWLPSKGESKSTNIDHSADEPKKNLLIRQLQSHISVLTMENKMLRNQLEILQNTEKAVETSRVLANNLKQCQMNIEKFQLICSKCGSVGPLNQELESQNISSITQQTAAYFPDNNVIEATAVSQEANSNILTKDTNKKVNGIPLKNLENCSNNPVPMTDIGSNVFIPTSSLAKFRINDLRHYLLDMVNAVYSELELANSSKSGRSKSEKKNKIDTTKQQIIADYTANIFPDKTKADIETLLSKIVSNKCKNTSKKVKMILQPIIKSDDTAVESSVIGKTM